MATKLTQNWIPIERIESTMQLEPALFILLLGLTSFIVYKLLLKGLNPERHRNLRRLFRNLFFHALFAIAQFAAYWVMQEFMDDENPLTRLLPYVGLGAIVWGGVVFVKTARIFTFEFLFIRNMQVGVPLLLVNLFTLILSLIIGVWFLSALFEFKLLSLVATSAVFSIVLGLALQDTLGNLFAGIALQIDKPYAIGDWVEIYNGSQKITGLVQEVTWRATILLAVTDEIITLPNRIVAQSQVSNFSAKNGPIIRSQVFRIPYGISIDKVRTALLKAADKVKDVRKHPEPLVLISESTDSWIAVKLIYYLDDFGKQFTVADGIISSGIESLVEAQVPLAVPRLGVTVTQQNSG